MFWFARVPTRQIYLFVRFRGSSSEAIYGNVHIPDSPINTLPSLLFLIFQLCINHLSTELFNNTDYITACPPFRLCFYPSTFFPSFPPHLFISLHHNICLSNFSLSSPTLPFPSTQHSTSVLYPLFLSTCTSSCIASIPQILLCLTLTLPTFPMSGSLPLPLPCFFMQKQHNNKRHGAMRELWNYLVSSLKSSATVKLWKKTPVSSVPWTIKEKIIPT